MFSNSAFVNNNNNSNSNDNNNSSSNNRTSSAILYQASSVSVCFGVLKAATGPDQAGTSTTRISIQVCGLLKHFLTGQKFRFFLLIPRFLVLVFQQLMS